MKVRVEVHIFDSKTGTRAIYQPGFDYSDDDEASGGWEFSNDMCDSNRLCHMAACSGTSYPDGHECGTERCFVKILEIGTGRVVYEEDGWVE